MPDRMITRLDEQAHILEDGMKALQRDQSDRRRLKVWIGLGCVAALVVIVLGFGILRAIEGQKAAVERSDCARTIANEQTDVKDHKEAIKDRITELGTQRALGLPLTEDPFKLLDEFSKARQAVAELPPTQVLVEKRCPSP